jgi:hypothetical protein
MDKSMSDMPSEERDRFACVSHIRKVDINNAIHLDVCPHFVVRPCAHTCAVHERIRSSSTEHVVQLCILCRLPAGNATRLLRGSSTDFL